MAPQEGLLEGDPGAVMGEALSAPYATDNFFVGDTGLVSVWDFDYDAIIDFKTRLHCAQFLLMPPRWLSCLCCYPCLLKKNAEWNAKAQHVALTTDGIHYVHEKHATMCGLSCTDKSRKSKMVPYGEITSCDVQEPEGTVCCCIRKVLSKVCVDTAATAKKDGPTDSTPELVLSGLKHPNAFKQAVYTMKHSEVPSKSEATLGTTAGTEQASRGINSSHLSERNRMLGMLLKKFPNDLYKDDHLRAEA